MKAETLHTRLPPNVKAWLAIRAADNGRSMNAEVLEALKTVMAAEPAYAVVRHCTAREGDFYCAALGESMDDFYTGQSREEAFAAARKKLAEIGFPRGRVEFREEQLGA